MIRSCTMLPLKMPHKCKRVKLMEILIFDSKKSFIFSTNNIDSLTIAFFAPGAHEPLKAAKERVTPVASKYKLCHPAYTELSSFVSPN